MPVLLGFTLAYALNPLFKRLLKWHIPKSISLLIIVISFLLLIFLIMFKVLPVLLFQILTLTDDLNKIIVNNNLQDIFNKINNHLFEYLKTGVTFSINLITNFVIVLTTSIYFLKDMDKIRSFVISKFNNSELLYKLDSEITNYFKGLYLIIIITFFEYSIIYLIIGHPQAIFLSFLAALANLIPQFGSLAVHIISLLTALVISPNLFVKCIIAVLIFAILDSYVINPLVYGKSNKLHPLLVILVLLIGSVTFGFMGMVIALPLAIILISIYNYCVN